jgi:hypothetical protein
MAARRRRCKDVRCMALRAMLIDFERLVARGCGHGDDGCFSAAATHFITRRSERRASLQGVPNVRAKGSTDHGGCDAHVSRDTSDLERARVTVFNPWVEAAPRETE